MAHSSTNHLLLIDGLNIVRRVYEANPAPDSAAKGEGATRASVSSIRRALDDHAPTHVLAAFDHGGVTWRHELYPAYHQRRKPKPQPLQDALPNIIRQIEGLGVPVVQIPGVEADDVIVSVYRHWAALDRGPATILSTDKDLATLVSEGAQIWNHFTNQWHDEDWIQNKFGVRAAQLRDLFALTGDSTDDIPGVPGVGNKTAARWLLQYGSLDALFEHASEISGKTGEALRTHSEQVRLARRLVDFKTDVTIGVTWKALRFPCRNQI